VRLLEVSQPYANHNGGGLAFGPDGYLYIGLGDGGAANDPMGNGQSLNTLLGKILRINVDAGNPYAIPPDNPFTNGGGRAEIWAYGLRNPWRFSFDALTGDLYIADVGQNIWEEVNFVPSSLPGGLNFGWDYREANHAFEGSPPEGLTLVNPVAEYNQAGGHCSITGGYVYRGQELPAWHGVYIYGDYCSGVIWGLVLDAGGVWQSQQLFNLPSQLSSFGVDGQGEIYAVGHDGVIYRLAAAPQE
jgi:glucose/arabinose dehydrogenase